MNILNLLLCIESKSEARVARTGCTAFAPVCVVAARRTHHRQSNPFSSEDALPLAALHPLGRLVTKSEENSTGIFREENTCYYSIYDTSRLPHDKNYAVSGISEGMRMTWKPN